MTQTPTRQAGTNDRALGADAPVTHDVTQHDEQAGTLAAAPPVNRAVDAATHDRVRALVAGMTLEQKVAQVVGFWEKGDGEVVAPLQGEFTRDGGLDEATRHGLGHLTRVYGTRPVDPADRAAWLWRKQRELVATSGIPALVHEECLTGLSAWRAATFPTPLAWGAAFDPDLVGRMATLIGESMRALGVHQGLAPVLDVVRDPRWGRVEECIAEDPYLIGEVGTAYVRGLQQTGVHATLKHFVGYSASQAGRNFAPVHVGRRELADVLLVPFEMAVRDGGVRSVMHAYTEIDGVPVASDPTILTDLLRGRWGFDGVVVADYFGVAFLDILHRVADGLGDAAGQALAAGIDIELPTGDAYLEPLTAAIRSGLVDECLVDRAATRALLQKAELGLLDARFDDEPPADVDLDSPAHREVAARLAEESVVLLANDGVLPLLGDRGEAGAVRRVAVVGPNADRAEAMFGCYSFVNHVLEHHPEVERGIDVPTVLEALRDELVGVEVTAARGCAVDDDDVSGIPEAVAAAQAADVAVVVVGDHAGLFGRGTVGEGCDRDDLELPGVQRELVEAVLATGTPVVLVVVSGRPYALDALLGRAAAGVQAFFPGEEGGRALAGVLTGRVNQSGRLPVSLPRSAGAQPFSYLHPALGGDGDVTNLRSTPVRPFGFGLSYTTFGYGPLEPVDDEVATDGRIRVAVRVTNTGQRDGDEVVQLYAHDPVASVTRPVAQLVGFRRVHLAAGRSATVRFDVPTTRVAFSGRDMARVVEPGALELWAGTSAERSARATVRLVGPVHTIEDDDRWTATEVDAD